MSTQRTDFRHNAKSAAHFTYAASGMAPTAKRLNALPLLHWTVAAIVATIAAYLLGL